MISLFEEIISMLIANAQSLEGIQKQKKLVTAVKVLMKHVKPTKETKEYIDLINELIDLHEKERNTSGNVFLTLINLEKYPNLRSLLIEDSLKPLPVDEVEDFIEIINTKTLALDVKHKTNHIIKKLSELDLKSDKEIVDEYKKLILSEYLHLLEYDDKKDVIEFDPNSLDSFVQIIEALQLQAKKKLKISTGYQVLDNYLNGGFEAGRIYLFGSPPGMGKSTLMLNFVANIIKRKVPKTYLEDTNKPPVVIYITLENEVLETYERLVRIFTKQEFRLSNLNHEDIEYVKDVLQNNMQTKLIIQYLKPGSEISKLILDVSSYAETHRIVAIFVDYLDLLTYDLADIKEKRFELGAITFTLKLLGKTFKCPVISPTQLNTAGYPDMTGKKIHIPTMKHLDESRQKAQNADFVGLMFPIHPDYIPAPLHVENGMPNTFFGINIDKNRDGKRGILLAKAKFNIYSIDLFNEQLLQTVICNILNGTTNSNNN